MKPVLNLRQIEAFRSVMLTGSVVGAARLMSVTQPGVSRTIGLMELRIGYALFERRGRRLVPTPEAEALYREIEQLYGSIERISQVAQDIRFQRAGALRVATLPALAQWLVPRAIARFLATRPNVTVFVQSLPSRQIAELVSTRQFDVGVVELPLSRPAIEIEPLEPVASMAVLPAGHRLASKKLISLKDLDGERMVMLSQHSFLRYQMDEAFSKLGVAPNVVLETPSSSIACALVAAGAGVTLVSRLTAAPFAGPDLVVRPVKEAIASRQALIFAQVGTRPLLADAFAKDLREEIRLSDLG
ncbi:MAG: LysR substrate-binding domain-containing protein [Rhodoferax sp.]|uniref:LysR substrate-binding domain-containing protein n=1 Tax=Rhodoferax sp. TaxID=50421 RepID=UPI002614F535|nr:LysR substrate-binding domain-containing protein [Rhodoferax sp.]MDD5333061.1 LysR substrate-binding domain-containing protein [Rhodoferax sp.]